MTLPEFIALIHAHTISIITNPYHEASHPTDQAEVIDLTGILPPGQPLQEKHILDALHTAGYWPMGPIKTHPACSSVTLHKAH